MGIVRNRSMPGWRTSHGTSNFGACHHMEHLIYVSNNENNYSYPYYYYYYYYYYRYHEGLGAGGVKFAPGFIGLVQLFSALVSGVFRTV